ncbi:MAG: helix-turn-helix transcriptional regulator [Ruthenibacterium sp.]
MIYTFGGAGQLYYHNKQIDLSAGTLLLFDPKEDCFTYHTTQAQWCFWWFEFTAPMVPLMEDAVYSIQLDNNFLGKFSKIFAMHKQQYYENAASVFGGIVSEIAYQIQTFSENNQRRTLLSHLQDDIQANLSTVTVQSLSRHAHLSDKSIRTLFHEFCNQSPKEYITAAKMQTAQYYLRATHISIAALAELLGYSSSFHFCKAFKQFTHTTPTLYRKQQ